MISEVEPTLRVAGPIRQVRLRWRIADTNIGTGRHSVGRKTAVIGGKAGAGSGIDRGIARGTACMLPSMCKPRRGIPQELSRVPALQEAKAQLWKLGGRGRVGA